SMTHTLTKVMGTPNRVVQALRDTVIPMVSHLAPFQHAFVDRLSELDIAYPDSPIVEGPGKRFFDDSMRGGGGIRSKFLLFVDADNAAANEPAARLRDLFADVLELRPISHVGVTLVRPDGYVAFESENAGLDAIAAARRVLERQTARAS